MSSPTDPPVSSSVPVPAKGALLAVFLTVFIDLLGFGMVIPLVAIYAKELVPGENGTFVVALLAISHPGMQFLFSPLWGRLSDRIGRRPVLLVGLFGSVVFYTIFGFATASRSLTWMFVSRIGAGLFGATIPTAQAYIADVTTKETRTKGMAIIGAAFGLGFTFGPLLAAGSMYISGADGLSAAPGYAAAVLSAMALVYAIFKLPETLTAESKKAKSKLLDIQALQTAVKLPTVFGLLMTLFVTNLAFSNFEAIMAYLLQRPASEGGFGYDIKVVVMMFAGVGLINAIAQGFVRQLSKRVSEAKLSAAGTLAAVIGFVILAIGTATHSLPVLIIGALLEASGIAFVPAPIQSLISRRSDPQQQGGILGLNQSLSALARIIGHGVCYLLFAVTAALPFWTGAGLMGVALLLVAIHARGDRDFVETSSPVQTAES